MVAEHILLQVIDALYSQLLWEEYGKTPNFCAEIFDNLRCLCFQVGEVVLLLPTVSSLLMNKIGTQQWCLSLTNEPKGNETENVLFVSAIDPRMHERFISAE